ncbi:Lrp/AsnC family transcriptional regulator, leucine-responsive regulatory protein [Amycolatopsis xylanica]|uniref:Lrp/AsnC family transcriptional regulator, leucine-responsive regulatory protein n=1 Tax=Amycolatopsis xylanica TaxID=589385 RepID=A0A1H3GGU1_9PSEU|nr:Lrp/AsnC family transcriptional regulator [Amycolatopsis xylanica]SDY02270.1 Lrp/AsnC family transcriptional regulator, leucine-responsive regulatory protein [Amycolatopsis xylanica]
MTNETLDEVDLRLLQALQADGRATHAALGKAVGLTGPSVYARIKRLERAGVIRGYTTIVDAGALGQDLVAYLRIGTKAGPDEAGPFEEFVHAEPRILECHDVDGEDSYIVKVRVGTPQELRALLAQVRALPDVYRTITSIALETIKETRGGGHLADPATPEDD